MALRDVVPALGGSGMPDDAEIEAIVARDLEQLGRGQDPAGGFDFWPTSRLSRPSPYLSVHVAHALVAARAQGYAVDATLLRRSPGYLADLAQPPA
ncbi:MAG: hypothetical protein IPK67_19760 [Planctomycetes bacterium]|nr:hypothetical protein [Planctomycetota bacterium]